jgi:hypothetical protein
MKTRRIKTSGVYARGIYWYSRSLEYRLLEQMDPQSLEPWRDLWIKAFGI